MPRRQWDGGGLFAPHGFLLVSANRVEVRLAEQTIDTLWVRPVCGGHAGVSGGIQSNWSRIGDMLVARCDARCVGVGSECVFRPSDVRQAGEPSADGYEQKGCWV